jgi:hypothetical protein
MSKQESKAKNVEANGVPARPAGPSASPQLRRSPHSGIPLSFPAAGPARCFGVLLWEAPSAEFAFAFSAFFDSAGAAFRFGAAISNRHATVTSRQGKSEAALLPLFYTKEANN